MIAQNFTLNMLYDLQILSNPRALYRWIVLLVMIPWQFSSTGLAQNPSDIQSAGIKVPQTFETQDVLNAGQSGLTGQHQFVSTDRVQVIEQESLFQDRAEARMEAPSHAKLQARDQRHRRMEDLHAFLRNCSIETIHQGLSALYASTAGDQWTNRDNWDVSTVPSLGQLVNWYGVTLANGCLQTLDLVNNNLTGTLPAEIGDLGELKALALSKNSLSGPIPPEIGNLTELEFLALDTNFVDGVIPAEIGQMSKLQEILLNNNALSGSIPVELSNLSDLVSLNFDENTLTGPIPPEFGNLTSLTSLSIGFNSLSGPIPTELANLTQLQELYLPANSLSGTIPVELGTLSELSFLVLEENNLTGSIPIELTDLSNLFVLALGKNSLTGPIPPALGEIPGLFIVSLGDNSLSGPVPEELAQLEGLYSLDISYNNLTGELPRSLMQLKNLEVLFFAGQDLCAPADDEFQQWLDDLFTDYTEDLKCSSSTSRERSALPESFTLRGNYPNPFEGATRLTFDLPWPSTVKVNVMDVTGRQIFSVPEKRIDAGWEKTIELNTSSLSSGVYLYHLIIDSTAGKFARAGRFIRMDQ